MEYLGNLYQTNGKQELAESILNGSSDAQLRLLCLIIHKIARGLIPIKRSNYKILHKRKRAQLLEKRFASPRKAAELVRDDREVQLEILLKLSGSFPQLFFR